MLVKMGADLVDCSHSFFNRPNGKESPPAGKVAAETRVLHHDRPAARQVRRTPVAKPSAIGCDVCIFAHAELTARFADVVYIGIDCLSDGAWRSKFPAITPQLPSRNVFPGYHNLQRCVCKLRQAY